MVLEALRSERANLQDHLSYLTRTKDGKILKSSTFYIRDDDGNAVGIFGINYDITLMLAMENSLKQFTSTEQENQEPEEISRNVSDLLDELIEQSVRVVGKPVALMNKEDKVKAIQFLNNSGAFLITKSGDKVCKFFGISKYTLYSYIDEAKRPPTERNRDKKPAKAGFFGPNYHLAVPAWTWYTRQVIFAEGEQCHARDGRHFI